MTDGFDPTDIATTVFDFARNGDAARVAAYIDAGVPANLTNHKGDTLVMLAAYHGHTTVVEVLIDREADINRVNDRGQTPLAGAVFKGHDDVVNALVDAGADPAAGTPSAIATARMFDRTDYLERFGAT